MQLFSKRNKIESYRNLSSYRTRIVPLITNELRNRLAAEISFLASMNDYLEFFILFENQEKEKIFLDENKVDGFSLSELGYSMTDYFEFEKFAIKKFKYSRHVPRLGYDKSDSEEQLESYFDDYKLFDLIEFIILFSKDNKREEIIDRYNGILLEEDSEYEIVNGMITKKSGEGIYSIKNLLKDKNLKQKIEDYEYYENRKDYLNMAKISSEIINIIFSNSDQNGKKAEIDKILKKTVAVITSKEKDKEELYKHMDSMLTNIKNLNNKIYNVRHTEKSTIHLRDGDQNILYKVISDSNMSFIELIVLPLKDMFISSEDWEKIKNNYIDKYKINKDQRFIIEKQEELKIEDIPF